MLSLRPDQVVPVLRRFAARDIAAAAVGHVTSTPQLWLRQRGDLALLWDLAGETFIGARDAANATEAAHA